MNLLKYIFSKKYREEASSRYSYNITKKIDKYNVNLEKLYSDKSKNSNITDEINILKEAYARDDIDEQEYVRKKQIIEGK